MTVIDPALDQLAVQAATIGNAASSTKSTAVKDVPSALDVLAAQSTTLAAAIRAYVPPPVIPTPPPPPIVGPDLVVTNCDLGVANGPVQVGQSVRVQPKTTVTNQGGSAIAEGTTLGLLIGLNPPIDPVTGKFKSSLEWGVALAYEDAVKAPAGGLKPGQSIVITTTKGTDGGFITIPTAVAGSVTVVPNIDNVLSSAPQGRIQESDETNNMLAVHVTVQGGTPPPPPPPGGGLALDETFFTYSGFGGTAAQEVLNREAQRAAKVGRPQHHGVLQMLDTTSPAAMASNMTSGYVSGARSWLPNTGGSGAVNTLGLRAMVFSIPGAFANGVNCAQVAQGAADAQYLAVFRSAKTNWLDKGIPVHLRMFWEGDGNWMKWAIEQNGNNAASVVAALDHVITLAVQVDPRFIIGWCGTMRWWETQGPKWDLLVPPSISARISEFIYDLYPRQHAGLDPGADGKGGYVRCLAEVDAWLAKPANAHLKLGLGEWAGGQTGGPGGGVPDWLPWTNAVLSWFKGYVTAKRASYQSWFNVFEGTEQADYRITTHQQSGAAWASA